MEPVTPISLTNTCRVHSFNQWQGRLTDGRWFYIHHKRGWFSVGIAATLAEAIDMDNPGRHWDQHRMSDLEMQAATGDQFDWEGSRL